MMEPALTHDEVARQVIKLCKVPVETKLQWMQNRRLRYGKSHTPEDFKKRCCIMRTVIEACLIDMNQHVADDSSTEDPIEFLHSKIILHMDVYRKDNNMIPAPPPVRRVCTGWYGCWFDRKDVAFQDWELVSYH
tara:strand:+ start:143 stop:544 length:402 start_codon:yes stop_codon:yes gene_type:complete